MKYAICNELFEGRLWSSTCRLWPNWATPGREVRPFAFDTHVAPYEPRRGAHGGRDLRAQRPGGRGMHWLLARSEGLHITSPDRDARRPRRRVP